MPSSEEIRTFLASRRETDTDLKGKVGGAFDRTKYLPVRHGKIPWRIGWRRGKGIPGKLLRQHPGDQGICSAISLLRASSASTVFNFCERSTTCCCLRLVLSPHVRMRAAHGAPDDTMTIPQAEETTGASRTTGDRSLFTTLGDTISKQDRFHYGPGVHVQIP